MITNVLLAVLVFLFCAAGGLTWWFIRRFTRQVIDIVAQTKETISDFVTPEAVDKPSKLGLALEAMSTILARAIVAQAKATFMGIESGASRQIKALEGDLAQDSMAQNPLAGLLSSFPNVSKRLVRNPALANLIGALAGGMMRNNPTNMSQGNGERPRFQF